MSQYFTYLQKNKLTGMPFYVGYSLYPSRYPWRTEGRRAAWQEAAKDGFTVHPDKVHQSPGEAYARQQRLIWEYWGLGVTLVNHIPKQQTAETRKKIAQSQLGNRNAVAKEVSDGVNSITLKNQKGRSLLIVPFDTLQGAELKYAKLKGADLRGADLRQANLMGANLQQADLRDADLRGAILDFADLSLAVLSRADIRDASFCAVNVDCAYMTGTRLYGTAIPGTKFDAQQKDKIDWEDDLTCNKL